jgi:hypothetical protein
MIARRAKDFDIELPRANIIAPDIRIIETRPKISRIDSGSAGPFGEALVLNSRLLRPTIPPLVTFQQHVGRRLGATNAAFIENLHAAPATKQTLKAS